MPLSRIVSGAISSELALSLSELALPSVLSLNETIGTFTHFAVNEEFYFT